MASRCSACHQFQHQSIPPKELSRGLPPVGGSHGTGSSELRVNCANCVSLLELPRVDDNFQSNEIMDHKMSIDEIEAEVDVKPPREERRTNKVPTFCLKDQFRLKEVEKVEDCFILEYNPYYPVVNFSSILESLYGQDVDCINVVQEGEVACRDYPHARHDCARYPFSSTPHYINCDKCYCYVCDTPAPCEQWTRQSSFFKHCEATPDVRIWKDLRDAKKRNVGALFDEIFSQDEYTTGVNNNNNNNNNNNIETSQSSQFNQLPNLWK